MSTFDLLMQQNKDFAAQQSTTDGLMPSLSNALPYVKALVIGCADMRVDPAHVLGLRPGEAVVIRNIGGRMTPGILEQLGLLGQIAQRAGAIPGGGNELHVIVLHHTDCGITRLAGNPDALSSYFEISKEALEDKAVTNPRAAVTVDVSILKKNAGFPDEWLVSGLVYNVATGLIEIVVPPAPSGVPQTIS